ncbi:F0F1 ATP synthase subunit A [Futiania mangrovi]|uniref:ATP synthase subunit a n=1 Tax=Futiania mangrovi TaxID=2959716 RepID=A0A9J6PAJ9_9PROT|nr:F0F1 ATP synthase subunit A [Futiania mangrovii]MCP1335070.1 F0F1 ATP synthase subunit A [Futiania mangrovii]
MTASPFSVTTAFELGPVAISETVVTTWGIVAALGLVCVLLTRRMRPSPTGAQAVLELFVSTLDAQIRATVGGDPARLRPLIGTLLVFILAANWISVLPGLEPPTAHLETDAALAVIVLAATVGFGIREQGVAGYLRSFARPTWVMVPLNLIEQVTRAFSLMVRLFGNVMSGVFVIGIVLSLAGLFVPIPLMALDLLTGAVQAYIFATLALVFIAAAVEGAAPDSREKGS